jgi:hypothetical protein
VRRSAKRGERTPTTKAAATVSKPPAARTRKPAAVTAAKPATASAKPPAPPRPKPPAAATAEPPRSAPRRKVPAAGYAAPNTRADAPPASAGAELISTTIQAAAELAQIGLTVGRQTLQSMLDRLPKP